MVSPSITVFKCTRDRRWFEMSLSTPLPCSSRNSDIPLRAEDSAHSIDSLVHQDDVTQDSDILTVQQVSADDGHHSLNVNSTENTNVNGTVKKYNTTSQKEVENVPNREDEDSRIASSKSDQNNEASTNLTTAIDSENQSETQSVPKKRHIPEDFIEFLETVYELLECPVCMNHMVPPIHLCESGHNVCYKCKPFMTRCPQCRGAFIQTRNVALEYIAHKLGFTHINEDDDRESNVFRNQITYTCPLTLFTQCYWQGSYSHIREHMEEMHASKILDEETNPIWEMKLVVKDFKIIFALDEIFFYKERLDTANSKFYIQVFYVGQRENHNNFSYHIELSSESGQQRFTMDCNTLPIHDLEHTYTFSASHCIIIDYQIVSDISKRGDLRCVLSLERN